MKKIEKLEMVLIKKQKIKKLLHNNLLILARAYFNLKQYFELHFIILAENITSTDGFLMRQKSIMKSSKNI